MASNTLSISKYDITALHLTEHTNGLLVLLIMMYIFFVTHKRATYLLAYQTQQLVVASFSFNSNAGALSAHVSKFVKRIVFMLVVITLPLKIMARLGSV